MTLNRVLILGTLALTTMMSPGGTEDIVGECAADGCRDQTWEKELEEEKQRLTQKQQRLLKGVLNIKQISNYGHSSFRKLETQPTLTASCAVAEFIMDIIPF